MIYMLSLLVIMIHVIIISNTIIITLLIPVQCAVALSRYRSGRHLDSATAVCLTRRGMLLTIVDLLYRLKDPDFLEVNRWGSIMMRHT